MRGAGGSVWGVVAALVPAAASAQTVDLRFARDASLRQCPDEGAFRIALEESRVPIARGPNDPRPGPNGVSLVDVRYLPGERPDAVRIEVRTWVGASVRDEFTQSSSARACVDSPRLVAPRIAFLLRPVRVERAEDASRDAGPVDASTPPEDASAPPSPAPTPPPPPLPLRAPTLFFVVFAGAGATFAGTPAIEPDVLLGVGLGGVRWRLRAQAILGLAREVSGGASGWSARRWLGDIAVCWMPFAVGLCGGLQAGTFEVERRTPEAPWSEALPQLSAVVRALLDQTITRRLRVWAAVDLTVQVVIPQVQTGASGGLREQWTSDGFGLGAAAGASLEIF